MPFTYFAFQICINYRLVITIHVLT